jgi:hypothetical protein
VKTDDLIDVLSTNFEAADRGKLWRALAGALTVGAAVAFGAMLVVLGARADAIDTAQLAFILTKLLFALSVIAIATILLIKHARPMAERHKTLLLLVVPFVAIAIGAVLTIVSVPWLSWGEMIFGKEWLTCLIFIPFFAAAPFGALVWAVRATGAPTDLARTGAIVGLLAGGIGAAAYAFHCPDDSLPFVAVWYGATIALCTFIGAKFGPWLLRW